MIPLRNADPLQLLQNQRHQHIVADWGKWVENSCCDNNDCFCVSTNTVLKKEKKNCKKTYLYHSPAKKQKFLSFAFCSRKKLLMYLTIDFSFWWWCKILIKNGTFSDFFSILWKDLFWDPEGWKCHVMHHSSCWNAPGGRDNWWKLDRGRQLTPAQ